jgi:ligand-binding sensor domain-containing protein/serine phosphatase RsbU (regulator of sigma subunit)
LGKPIFGYLKAKGLYKVNIFLLLVLFLAINTTYAQSYQFSKYNIEQGLPQQYVYSLNQDNNGFIWIGTGDGISKFDGIDFQNFTTKDGLAENFISCSAQRHENIIWLGHNKGGISRIINGNIVTIVSDSLVGSKITDIVVDQDNYIWATSQNGYLIKISPKLEVKKFNLFANQKNINAIVGKIEEALLVGTDEGLFLWSLNNMLEPSTYVEINELKLKTIQCITESKSLENNYWVGTAESGLYQLKFTENKKIDVKSTNNDFGIGTSFIQNIEEDNNKNLWVSTYSGLFKIIYDEKSKGLNKTVHYGDENGIGNFIKMSLVDREGNAWIGMYGEGLAMLKDEIFTFYNHSEDESIPNDTRCFLFQDNVKWYGLSKGLLGINAQGEKKYYSAKNGFKDVAVTTILKRGDDLFLGTDGEGLYRFNVKTEKFTKEFLVNSYLSNNIHKMVAYINELWVATDGGLIKKNLVTKKSEVYNTLRGLKHNSIYDVFMLRDGSVVLSSHSNELTFIKNGEVSHKMVADLDQLMDIVAIETGKDNKFWLATLGNGVFKQEADSFVHISTEQGLKTDYCYSIVSDNKNGIWVGHRGGLSRINEGNLSVQVFDNKKGVNVDFNKGGVYKDKENNVWFGTNKKVIKFNPKKFIKNTTPPAVSIKNIFISDKKVDLNEKITLPYNSYKLKIEFIGISFKQPEGVKYQHFLEGYDLDWTESSFNNFANYPRIEDGTYTFYVKACNNDGFCSEETLAFQIVVAAPFWKKWWFFVSVFIIVVLLIYFIIKMRERKQKEIQKNLEIELDKRTKEVVKKSEEIEEKNKNITDSINYALKIQKSILPSKKLMKDYFPESFVFYQPRDIVSGDFYWYEKIGNKFIVACADCTGHGVPGAFMSMISSTLFKEIAHQYQITEPSEFLYKLDELLKNTLKQSVKAKIHDGLDMSICIFDLDTNHLSFSGAYRPVVLYRDKTLELIKTTPFSIGGDDFIEKEFKTINVQLKPGDIVYLFTDGFPDQFGGKKGKKLYLKGFKTLIENSADIKMDNQHLLFKRFLNDWKGDLKQIDDILVMGIKIS